MSKNSLFGNILCFIVYIVTLSFPPSRRPWPAKEKLQLTPSGHLATFTANSSAITAILHGRQRHHMLVLDFCMLNYPLQPSALMLLAEALYSFKRDYSEPWRGTGNVILPDCSRYAKVQRRNNDSLRKPEKLSLFSSACRNHLVQPMYTI